MAQITYRANLSAKSFPFVSENFGRSIIVAGPDQNFSRQLVASEDTDKDVGIPQVYYCHNIMPHTAGLQSVGYGQITAQSEYYGENPNNTFKNIYLLRDGASNIAYLGVTKNGYFYITDDSGAGWVQKKPVAIYTYTSALKVYPGLKDIGAGKLTWTTVGGAALSQAKAISGDGSLKLDGTGYITPTNAVNANEVFNIGTNDFVKSIWAYPENVSGNKTIWSRSTAAGVKIALELQDAFPIVKLQNAAGSLTTLGATVNAPMSPASVAAGANTYCIQISNNNLYAYVTNFSAKTLQLFDIDSNGALTLRSAATITSAYQQGNCTLSADGNYLYVCTENSLALLVYALNATTGAPSLVQTVTYTFPAYPYLAVASTNGNYVYVIASDNYVYVYRIVSNSLTFLQKVYMMLVQHIAISNDNKFIYTGNSSSLEIYTVNQTTGLPTYYSYVYLPTRSVIVSKDNKYVYALHYNGVYNFTVAVYTRNTSTGNLTFKQSIPSSISGFGLTLATMTLSPDGFNLYIAGVTSNLVAVINVKDGVISAATPATFASSTYPRFVSVSPNGKNIYVANYDSGTVRQYFRSTPSISAAAWTKLAVRRNVNTFTLEIAGAPVATATFSSALDFDATIPETIGAQVISGVPTQGFIGYLDNIAYTKGSATQPELLTNLTDPPAFTESKALVTTAYVAGVTYIYVEKVGCYKYDFALGVFVDVELVGLVAQNILGITNSSGYLIAWSESNVSWSSSIDPTDFTPSLETGAGGGPIEAAKGSINYCVPHTLGFIIGTDDNCIAALYQNNSRYPFLFREIVGSGGMSSLDLISLDANSSALYAYTTSGMQLINTSQTQTVFPEITDFISGRYFEDFDDITNEFSRSYISGSMQKRLAVIADRYLVVSYGIYELTHAIVYDLVLKRYGKLKFTHVECFTYKIATDTIKEIPRQSIAFLTKDGSIYLLDLAIASNNLNGTLVLGKYQYVRSRLLQLNGVTLESSRANQNFELQLMPSLDGKTTKLVTPYGKSIDGLQKEYLCREIGANHSLLIRGGFLLNSLLLNFTASGKV